jgi:hypothetical protein
MKYKFRTEEAKDPESPCVLVTAFSNGSARVTLTYYTQFERAGVHTQVEHQARFILDYDEIACIGKTLAGALNEIEANFNNSIDEAKSRVRRELG